MEALVQGTQKLKNIIARKTLSDIKKACFEIEMCIKAGIKNMIIQTMSLFIYFTIGHIYIFYNK